MSEVFISAGSADSVYLDAQNQARRQIRPAPKYAIVPDASGSAEITLGPGDHVLTTPNALLGREGMTAKAVGLKIKAAAPGITNVILDVRSPCAVMSNNFWQGITIEGIQFIAGVPGCTGFAQYADHSAQRVLLDNVIFQNFTKPVAPLGAGVNDNNSEWTFRNCTDDGTTPDGAFLFTGTDGSDQFLNFKWEGIHRHWGSSAPLIDAAKGGHFHIDHLDASNWGAAGGKLINLRGSQHAYGVCSLTVDHLRAELMSPDAGLLFSEWGYGSVTLRDVDLSSQAFRITSGDVITIISGPQGVKYVIEGSQLPGFINVSGLSQGGGVVVRDSWMLQQANPVRGTGAAQVVFDNCSTWTQAGVSRLDTRGGVALTPAQAQMLAQIAQDAAIARDAARYVEDQMGPNIWGPESSMGLNAKGQEQTVRDGFVETRNDIKAIKAKVVTP